jgi:tRNA-dihydrouridine synthase
MSSEPTDLAMRLIGRQLEGIGDAVKRLAAVAQQSSEPQSSVELVQNAKGATQIAVKVYHREPEQAAATAQQLYDELASRYNAGGPAADRSAP